MHGWNNIIDYAHARAIAWLANKFDLSNEYRICINIMNNTNAVIMAHIYERICTKPSNDIKRQKEYDDETKLLIYAASYDEMTYIAPNGDTLLIAAIRTGRVYLASILIGCDDIDIGHANNDNDTALSYACYKQYGHLAMELIATGKSNPDVVHIRDRTTALIWACYNRMRSVCLALIATGRSRPDIRTSKGNTPLLLACQNQLSDVAMKLLETRQSNPDYISSLGNTALLYASRYDEQLSIAIINTKQSMHTVINDNHMTAYKFAEKHGYHKLMHIIDNYDAYIKSLPIDDDDPDSINKIYTITI